MQRSYRIFTAVVVLGLAALLAALPCAAANVQGIADLIRQLGSSRYSEREEATQSLEALGPPALDALQEAARSEDVEVARRAEELTRRITRRAETARLLMPKTVRVAVRETSVPDAVSELSRAAGYAISLEGDRTRLLSRRVTFDTGEVPFWNAFDQLSRASGLVERPLALTPGRPSDLTSLELRQRLLLESSYRGTLPSISDGRLVLIDGKPLALPTCYAGAVRIRAVPAPGMSWNALRVAGEVLLGLEVSPEPGMAWQGVTDVRVDRALDDRGQELMQPMMLQTSLPEVGARVMFQSNVPQVSATAPVPMRLRLGTEPSRLLRELRGTVTAVVQTPPETLWSVENVLQSAGRTLNGADGGAVKILEAARHDDGTIRLRIQLDATTGGMLGPNGFAALRLNGRVIGRSSTALMPTDRTNWNLRDAKGQSFQLTGISTTATANVNGASLEVRLTFQPPAQAEEPVRLACTGRRAIGIDIPFVLENVSLP